MIFDTYQRMRVYGTSWAGTSHTYSKGWVDFVLVILHFFGDLAIFLLFCNHQNTKSESRDMEIGVSGPIFTHKNIKGSLVQWNTYNKKLEENIVAILHIYGVRSIFLWLYKTKTSNLIHMKYKLVYLDQYSHRNDQRLYGITILILHMLGAKHCSKYSYLWS